MNNKRTRENLSNRETRLKYERSYFSTLDFPFILKCCKSTQTINSYACDENIFFLHFYHSLDSFSACFCFNASCSVVLQINKFEIVKRQFDRMYLHISMYLSIILALGGVVCVWIKFISYGLRHTNVNVIHTYTCHNFSAALMKKSRRCGIWYDYCVATPEIPNFSKLNFQNRLLLTNDNDIFVMRGTNHMHTHLHLVTTFRAYNIVKHAFSKCHWNINFIWFRQFKSYLRVWKSPCLIRIWNMIMEMVKCE